MSMLILLLLQLLWATNANSSEKLNIPNPSVKCGSCPCVNPCSQQALPPPPPSPPPITTPCPPTPQTPPPPRFIYVTSISTPPPPRFTYVTGGPPGNLYPTDDPFSLQVYSSNGGSQVVFESLQLTICSGLILGLIFLLF